MLDKVVKSEKLRDGKEGGKVGGEIGERGGVRGNWKSKELKKGITIVLTFRVVVRIKDCS